MYYKEDTLDYDEITDDLSGNFTSSENVKKGSEFIEENIWAKVEEVGKRISFVKDIKALVSYMLDRNVAWYRKSIVVGALIYFIAPIDTIPDIAPLIGYLDDLGVITAVLKYMGSELVQYYD